MFSVQFIVTFSESVLKNTQTVCLSTDYVCTNITLTRNSMVLYMEEVRPYPSQLHQTFEIKVID